MENKSLSIYYNLGLEVWTLSFLHVFLLAICWYKCYQQYSYQGFFAPTPSLIKVEVHNRVHDAGLTIRVGGLGFPPATMKVAHSKNRTPRNL